MSYAGHCKACGRWRTLLFKGGHCSTRCWEESCKRRQKNTVDFKDVDSIKPITPGRRAALIEEAKRLFRN